MSFMHFFFESMLGKHGMSGLPDMLQPGDFFFSSRRRHTSFDCDWSSDVCSSDLFALYSFITGLESQRPIRFYGMWAALALALLTKGLIAPVFFAAAALPLLLLSGQWRRWRELKPITGVLLFLAVAAPWHILCGLANPDQGHPVGNHPAIGNVHGFWYFYFLNEHVFRFLGTRFPHDYNRMPVVWYWAAHLVWLFPWSLFLPAAVVVAWRTRHSWLQHLRRDAGQT